MRLRDLLTIGNSGAVASILELMARDFRAMRDGFPDLMLVKDDAVDVLSRSKRKAMPFGATS